MDKQTRVHAQTDTNIWQTNTKDVLLFLRQLWRNWLRVGDAIAVKRANVRFFLLIFRLIRLLRTLLWRKHKLVLRLHRLFLTLCNYSELVSVIVEAVYQYQLRCHRQQLEWLTHTATNLRSYEASFHQPSVTVVQAPPSFFHQAAIPFCDIPYI